MIHLTLQQLSCFLDGELTEASTELIRRHLSECATCTGRFARIEAQEEIMARVLVDEPDDPFFRQLSDSLGLGSVAGTKPSETTPAASKAQVTVHREEEKQAAAVPAREAKAKSTPKPAREKKAKARPTPDANANAKPASRAEVNAPPPPLPAPEPEPTPHTEREAEAPRLPAPEPQAAPVRAREAVKAPPPRRRAEDVGRQRHHAVAQRITIAALVVILGSLAWVVLHRWAGAPATGQAPAPAAVATTPQPEPEATSPEATPAPEPAPESTPAPPVESPEPVVATSPSSDVAPPVEATPTAEPQTPTPTLKPAPKATPRTTPKATAVRTSPPTRVTRAAPSAPEATQPEHIVERAPKIVVPVRTIITETIVDPEGRADSAVAPSRPSSPTAPASGASPATAAVRAISDAKNASLRAATAKDPVAWDAAATTWDRAIPLLSQSPEDLAVARRELAQARFQAWAESPTAARRDAAIAAARVYLLYAPPGPERDQAWTWLARLKR